MFVCTAKCSSRRAFCHPIQWSLPTYGRDRVYRVLSLWYIHLLIIFDLSPCFCMLNALFTLSCVECPSGRAFWPQFKKTIVSFGIFLNKYHTFCLNLRLSNWHKNDNKYISSCSIHTLHDVGFRFWQQTWCDFVLLRISLCLSFLCENMEFSLQYYNFTF